jgi:predicted acyltransferase
LLSTLPAVATVMLGTIMAPSLVSERPLADRINSLFVAGTVLMVGGWAWSGILPINKNLWTSSYVLFSAGLAAMAIAFCTWVVDLRGSRWWTRPFVIFGVNPFVAFIGSGVLARLIYSVITVPDGSGGRQSLEQAIYLGGFASWLPPRLGSLAFAMSFVLLWLGVLTMLHRRHLILKI